MKKSTYKIVTIGVLSALVFVSNYLSIPIGDITRIHLANGVCLMAGLVAGPVVGGLAAGIGSATYDLLNPLYITSAPFTFVFKFLMAYIAGVFMKKATSPKSPLAITGCCLGQLAYIVLHLTKTFVKRILQGSSPEAVVPEIITSFVASLTNAVIAVIIATLLSVAVKKALTSSKLSQFTQT